MAACQRFKQSVIVRVIGPLQNQRCQLVVGFNNTIEDFKFNLILKNGQWEFSINPINVENKVLLKTWVNIDFSFISVQEVFLGKSLTPHPYSKNWYGMVVLVGSFLLMFLYYCIFEILKHFHFFFFVFVCLFTCLLLRQGLTI